MSVWILHQLLTPEEEAAIESRGRLLLPFDGVPDLSFVENIGELTRMLAKLHPDLPVETLNRRAERYWELFHGLQQEDLLAVPLHAKREVALAKISGRYGYEAGVGGEDVHSIGVSWYNVHIPLVKLGKHKPLFENYRDRLVEVTDPDARQAIRKWLPHSYNRFAKWKWILAVLFILQIISMLMRK
jgi:hypothetical protein